MLAGAVDNLPGTVAATITATTPTTSISTESSLLDKISDVIPGDAGQKVEDFAKSAAHKAKDVYDDVNDKLSGLFAGDKNKPGTGFYIHTM